MDPALMSHRPPPLKIVFPATLGNKEYFSHPEFTLHSPPFLFDPLLCRREVHHSQGIFSVTIPMQLSEKVLF